MYAEIAALVFNKKNIRTYIFKTLTPTPVLAYASLYLGTSAAINITSSHNAKEYNGYKPVRNERIVYKSYRNVSIKRGPLKTLMQWEAQVRSDFAERKTPWLNDTVNLIEYNKKSLKNEFLICTIAFFPIFAAFVTAAIVFSCCAIEAFGVTIPLRTALAAITAVGSMIAFVSAKAMLNKILFYDEFARILRDMAKR